MPAERPTEYAFFQIAINLIDERDRGILHGISIASSVETLSVHSL